MEFTSPRLLAVPHKRHHKARMGSNVETLPKPEIMVETEVDVTHEDNTQDDLSNIYSCSISCHGISRKSTTTGLFTKKSNITQPRGVHQTSVDKHAGVVNSAEEVHATSSPQELANSLCIVKKGRKRHSWAGSGRMTEEVAATTVVHGSTHANVPQSENKNRRHSAHLSMELVSEANGLQHTRSVGGPTAYGNVRNEEQDLPVTDAQW